MLKGFILIKDTYKFVKGYISKKDFYICKAEHNGYHLIAVFLYIFKINCISSFAIYLESIAFMITIYLESIAIKFTIINTQNQQNPILQEGYSCFTLSRIMLTF